MARDYLELYRSVVHEASDPLARASRSSSSPTARPACCAAPSSRWPRLPVTVVDNSSLPEIAALCAELGVRYLDPGRNGGFAAGVNVALADRLVPGADVLLLNPDAVISADDVAVLHRALPRPARPRERRPAQVDDDGRAARVEWWLPSPAGTWLEALGLARLRRGPTYVIGSVLLLRAEALDQVGGFDERFFLYAEEADWAYRAHRLGWRHAAVPEARARARRRSHGRRRARREAHFHASQERYLRKHYGALGLAVGARSGSGSGRRGAPSCCPASGAGGAQARGALPARARYASRRGTSNESPPDRVASGRAA